MKSWLGFHISASETKLIGKHQFQFGKNSATNVVSRLILNSQIMSATKNALPLLTPAKIWTPNRHWVDVSKEYQKVLIFECACQQVQPRNNPCVYGCMNVLNISKNWEQSCIDQKRHQPNQHDMGKGGVDMFESYVILSLCYLGDEISHQDQVWVADITYIRLKGRFIYLCLLMDVFTRMIRAWQLSQHLTQSLTLTPLKEAFCHSVPEIHDSDQGVQYLSIANRNNVSM